MAKKPYVVVRPGDDISDYASITLQRLVLTGDRQHGLNTRVALANQELTTLCGISHELLR